MKQIFTLLILLAFTHNTIAQDFDFGEVSKEEVLEKSHPIDKEANAAILYRDYRVYYEFNENTGFTLVTDVHERIKIYNKEGYDWATKEILAYKDGSSGEDVSVKGYTYNIKNGKLVDEKLRKKEVFEEEADKYHNKTKFTMPAVTDGSVIEYRYSIRSPFTTSIDKIALQETIPINRLEADVSIPEYLGFKIHVNPKSPVFFNVDRGRSNFSYNFTTTRRGNMSLGGGTSATGFNNHKLEFLQDTYTVQKNDIPALKLEPHVDYLYNYAAYLKWELQYTKFPNSTVETFSTTWEDVAKSIYRDLGIEKEIERDNYFDKDLDELLAGVSDPMQKALMIYNFVKSKVKWNEIIGIVPDEGGKAAYKDGKGSASDINLMLTAMLKYAGLNASPVLLSTPSNGIPLFPTRQGFNYLISSIELEDQIVLLDATDEKAAFGQLPARARNWQGRLIREEGSSDWVSLIPNYKSKNETILNVKIDDQLKLEGKSMNIYNGLYAKAYRDNYLGLDSEEYLQTLEKDKGEIVISELEIENAEKIGEAVKETYNFELKNVMESIDGKLYLNPLLFTALKENPFKAAERNYPIFFDFPSSQGSTINIMLPKGYKIESMPKSGVVKFKDNAGIFKYIVNQNANFLRIQTELDMNNIVYSAADYEFLKQFYSQMVEKHSEVIVLSKT